MKLDLYQRVVLSRDVVEENLKRGDVAWLVDYATDPNSGEEGYILEIFNILGESIAVTAVPASAVAPLSADLVPSARVLEQV